MIGRRPQYLTKGQEPTAPAIEHTLEITVARNASWIPTRAKKYVKNLKCR